MMDGDPVIAIVVMGGMTAAATSVAISVGVSGVASALREIAGELKRIRAVLEARPK